MVAGADTRCTGQPGACGATGGCCAVACGVRGATGLEIAGQRVGLWCTSCQAGVTVCRGASCGASDGDVVALQCVIGECRPAVRPREVHGSIGGGNCIEVGDRTDRDARDE